MSDTGIVYEKVPIETYDVCEEAKPKVSVHEQKLRDYLYKEFESVLRFLLPKIDEFLASGKDKELLIISKDLLIKAKIINYLVEEGHNIEDIIESEGVYIYKPQITDEMINQEFERALKTIKK
jgi:hypothetical protein